MLDIWGPTQSQHMIIVNLGGRVDRFCPPGSQIHSFSLLSLIFVCLRLRHTKIMDFEQSLHMVNAHKHWVSWSQKLSQHLFSQIHTYPKHTLNGLSHFMANFNPPSGSECELDQFLCRLWLTIWLRTKGGLAIRLPCSKPPTGKPGSGVGGRPGEATLLRGPADVTAFISPALMIIVRSCT